MKIYRNIYIAVFIFVFSVIVFCCTLFNFELAKVSNDDTLISVTIEKGGISDVAKTLKEHNLIKSESFFILYVKMTGNTNLIAADYELSPNMGSKKIVEILSSGEGANSNQVNITFNEGINMRKVASIISDNTNNTEEDVYNLLSDEDYLKELIDKYWFLDNVILDDGIYYSLEGYLYPNTYSFSSKDVSVKEIINSMLDETDNQLSKYKSMILSNSLSIHDILTLSSMVELEAVNEEDRRGVASVFLNRLNSNMSLGSDVTTYYASKVDMGERDLYSSELSACNNYNTRCATFKTLPIGPVCNPSITAILAVLEPTDTNYYYFVADINGDIYFSKNSTEQTNIINNLKNKGLWYEY
jgi:UPF0755 protein